MNTVLTRNSFGDVNGRMRKVREEREMGHGRYDEIKDEAELIKRTACVSFLRIRYFPRWRS